YSVSMRSDISNIFDRVALSPTGASLASQCVIEGQVCLWNTSTGTKKTILSGKNLLRSHALGLSHEAGWLALGSSDGEITLIDLKKPESQQIWKKDKSWFTVLQFSPDGSLLASGDQAGQVLLWNTANGSSLELVLPSRSWTDSITFSPDGHRVAV